MHTAERRGYLAVNGRPMSDEFIAAKCGCDVATYRTLLDELFAAGVPRRTSDGIIYNKRMVDDEKKRKENAEYQRKHRNKADVRPVSDESKAVSLSSSSTTKQEPKPPASAPPRGTIPKQDRVSKGLGDSRHHRVEEIVKGWYLDWAGVECPWDGGEAAQLSRMLKAWPNQPDQQFITCLENLARSDCIPKGDRPREWLGKLPKFLQSPLDQYWKPKRAGGGNHQQLPRAVTKTNYAAEEQLGVKIGK